jgi:hypothetical protein
LWRNLAARGGAFAYLTQELPFGVGASTAEAAGLKSSGLRLTFAPGNLFQKAT